MNAELVGQLNTTLIRRLRHWDRRLRLVTTVTWMPRGAILGLATGVALAIVARLRPWLLPEEVIRLTALVVAVIILALLLLIWLWPRSLVYNARYFDWRFDLKERMSTALELLTGRIAAPPALAERQLTDAAQAAARVRPAAQLPLRVRWGELLAVLVLAGALAWLLTDNPQAETLRARRDLDAAIAAQVTALEEAIQAVEQNPQLSPTEQMALAEPLREALEILAQSGVSQEEAVAALAEAAQALGALADGLLPEEAVPYQQAARELAGAETTAAMAEALRRPDLGQAAAAMDTLSRDLVQSGLSAAQRQELAQRFEQAADALQAQNPALSERLRDVAEALRNGDMAAAQEAMQGAAQVLRAQQRQLEQSALAEAARTAQQQVGSGQRQVAQAGHEQPAEQAAEAQTNEPQAGTGEQASGGQGAQESAGNEAEPGAGTEMLPGSEQGGQTGAEEGEPETSESAQGEGGAASGQSPAAAGQAASAEQGEEAVGLGAGSGEGGAGVDTTSGAQSEGGTWQVPANVPEGEFHEDYVPENAPTTLGGEPEQLVDVGGEVRDAQGLPILQGELAPNPAGEATLSYTGALRAFRAVVSQALESGRIPLDQRDVIHDYFSSLAR